MQPTASGYEETLRDLVELRSPVPQAIAALRGYPQSMEPVLPLTRADARRLLLAFLNGVVTAQECDAWANAVEGRDDLDYDDETLVDFLFEIGTPELTRELTAATATEWLARLGAPA